MLLGRTCFCVAWCVAALAGADAESNRIVGRWRSLETSKGGIGAMFEFRDGGAVAFSPGAVVDSVYRVEGRELVLPPATNSGPEQRMRIVKNGEDDLALDSATGGRMELKRAGKRAGGDDPLLGEWVGTRDMGGRTVETRFFFYPGGKALLLAPFTRVDGTWSATTATIKIALPGREPVEGSYSVEGDTLTLPGSRGTGTSRFRRY
jgi:hypothetical protein